MTNGTSTLTGSAPSGTFNISFPLVLNSVNAISFISTDLAGHVATGSMTVTQDNIAPTIALSPTPAITASANLTVSGTTEPLASVVLANGGTGAVGTTADASGSFSLTIALNADATNLLTVDATDPAGNPSATTSFSVVQVTTPLSLTLNNSGSLTMNANTFVFDGTSKSGAIVTLSGTSTGSVAASSTGSWSFLLNLPQDATSVYDISATDGLSTLTGSLSITEDSTAPTVSVSGTGFITNAATFTLTGTTEIGTTVTASGASTVASATGAFSLTFPIVPNTTNAFTLVPTDLAGNAGTGMIVSIVSDTIAPVIASISYTGSTLFGATIVNYGFSTDELTNSILYVGTAASVLATQVWSGSTSGLAQSGMIVGLTVGTTYFSFVRATDLAGNITDSTISSFVASGTSTGGGSTGTPGTPAAPGAPVVSTGGGGGGGGTSAASPSLFGKDICPNGDYSPSLYDGYCGTDPNAPKPPTTSSGATTSSGTTTVKATTTSKVRTPNLPVGTRTGIAPATSGTSTPAVPSSATPSALPQAPAPLVLPSEGPVGFQITGGPIYLISLPRTDLRAFVPGDILYIKAERSVALRQTSSMKAKAIAFPARNDRVELLAIDGEWLKVRYGMVEGYLLADYLRHFIYNDVARIDPRLFEAGYTVDQVLEWKRVGTYSINVRAATQYGARVKTKLPNGETVVVLDRLPLGWVEIRHRHGTGYVLEKFLK